MRIPLSLLPMWHVAAEDNPRYDMHGLRLERRPDGRLNVVACNGRVLIVAEVDTAAPDGFTSAVIPRHICRVAAQVSKKTHRTPVTVEFVGDLATLEVPTGDGNVRLTAPAVTGRYPEWQPIIDALTARPMLEPTEEQRRAMVPAKLGVRVFRELLAALEGMGLETVDFYLPAFQLPENQKGSNEEAILFRAVGDGVWPVVGCVMPVAGKSKPV